MSQHNPWVIPRNHLVEQALNSAQEQGDMQPFHALLKELQTPHEKRDLTQNTARPRVATSASLKLLWHLMGRHYFSAARFTAPSPCRPVSKLTQQSSCAFVSGWATHLV